ncbi:hypothetical protein GQ457_13G015630 [Hibiscus cannabinus]
MKEDELIKDFSTRLMDVVNQIRLYGENLPHAKLEAQEQRVSMRAIEASEGAFLSAHKGKEAKKQPQHQANASEENQEEDEHLFLVSHVAEPSHNSVWLVDSGCTSHMTLVAAYFSSLDKSFERSVKMGNGATFAEMKMKNNSFYLKLDVVCEHVYRAKDNVSPLWHKRMGHFNLTTLKHMQSNDFVTDLPMLNISDDKCDSYQLGKSHRLLFSLDGVKRANMKLELVHSDLCGPMKTSFMNGSKYFVVLIDDLTRMCWVYFLKSKLNVLSSFKEFKIFAENQSDCKLKVLRIDNGGEYSLRKEELNSFRFGKMLATKVVNGKTPLEAWSGSKPSVKHLRAFDSYWNWEKNDVQKHDLMPISEELIITEDAENGETSDWFDVAGTTNADEVIKTKSLASVFERCNLVFAESTSFDAAAKVPEWIDAMKSEISGIEKNGTWFLTDLPSGKHVIGVKWVYKTKFNPDGSIFKHKARLVVKGYAQIGGVDYGNTFAPVARLDTIRLLIVIAGQLGWNVFHLDVKSAFLNGELEEDIYIYQPEGFVVPGKEHQKLGFQRSVNEATLYLKKDKNAVLLVISLYIDDLLVMRSNNKAVSEFKLSMQKEFEMSDLGLMSYFLVMEINQSKADIFISQKKFLSSPTDIHLGVAKRVLRYLKSILGEGLDYLKMDNVVLTGYSDSDWAGSLDYMKSISGYVFNLGSSAICWSSKKQQVVAQSTTEAEYIAAAAANQTILLRNLLSDLGFKQESATVLLCDNKSAIIIAENPVQHGITKHINDVEKYKLGNPRTFHYLNQSNCIELDVLDDSKEYLETRRAMDVVGINQAEQESIFRVVAGILHLGNVEFTKGKETDAAEPKDDKSRLHLKTVAELFMCDEKSLGDSLVKRVIVTRGESITKALDPSTAALSRDALAKIVYSKLFDWLVEKINISIGQDSESKFLIGVLDIYGFESFKTNSFEQFCINLTNEKLQQHFNQHVFKMEQEEYKKEKIDWSYIEFVDNQDILDLIEKKPGGIIALLDEACMFPRSTHETFAQKLYQTFKDHKRFIKPKLARTDFTICHYAGDVTYQTDLFLEKNKDLVVPEHQALLGASRCSFLSSLFPPVPQESSKSSKLSSIASGFKGVLEAIRISCAGFPSRKIFREFIDRFSILAPEVLNGSYNEVTACKKILEKSGLSGYQVGKTKVFLRAGQMAELDTRRSEILGVSAKVIQKKVRAYLSYKHFKLLRLSSITIQAFYRGQVARHQYERVRRSAACLKIQKHSRKFLARKAYKNLYFSSVSIQAGIRGMNARKQLLFKKQVIAATIIQLVRQKK